MENQYPIRVYRAGGTWGGGGIMKKKGELGLAEGERKGVESFSPPRAGFKRMDYTYEITVAHICLYFFLVKA